MQISVIIPVYNAENYVQKAVQSALQQLETAEVLLIEDCSPDNSLKICRELEEQYEKVRLVRHHDGKNHGAGATRNLGIENAKYDYIAFLDADDFYLPDRFKYAKKLFEEFTDVAGVYEAVGVDFLSTSGKQKWLSRSNSDLHTITVTDVVNSHELFEALVTSGKGTIHLNGLTVKKRIFNECGYFFKHLKLHQDTAMVVQMSVCGKLIPGRLNVPVAMRTVHDQNRILNQHDQRYDKFLYWKTLFYWAREKRLSNRRLKILYHNYIFSMYLLARNNSLLFPRNLQGLKPLFVEPLRHPFWFIAGASQFFFGRFIR
jgi:glycosyltransferase involved in cell wall biosynthesis